MNYLSIDLSIIYHLNIRDLNSCKYGTEITVRLYLYTFIRPISMNSCEKCNFRSLAGIEDAALRCSNQLSYTEAMQFPSSNHKLLYILGYYLFGLADHVMITIFPVLLSRSQRKVTKVRAK